MTSSKLTYQQNQESRDLVVNEQHIEEQFIKKLIAPKYTHRSDIHDRDAVEANCLSSLDALITAQTEQIVALKAHKKGLMQQLFPNLERSKSGEGTVKAVVKS